MARLTTVPWPPETHENHRLIIYKIERVTVSLLTLLNEAGENPPNYEPYQTLLPNMRRRLTEANEAAIEVSYYIPDKKGGPPMWVKLTRKVIKSIEQMLGGLDLIEARAAAHEYDTVVSATEVMLDACLELLEGFKRVPLPDEDDTEIDTQDNNGDVLYLLDFNSCFKK